MKKNSIEPQYNTEVPSYQAAVDIFKGMWKSSFPKNTGISAGQINNFTDARVIWADEAFGGFRGRSVLELGPFEAYNTWQISELEAKNIIAVEGNSFNYLKCLITKEVLGIRAKFIYGDILQYLKNCSDKFDISWATGVLYHQTAPLDFIHALCAVSQKIYIWTHFFDEVIENNPRQYPKFNFKKNVDKSFGSYTCRHYIRSYKLSSIPGLFSGGNSAFAYWLTKSDIFAFIEECGFSVTNIRGINMKHKEGPTISFIAERK